MLKAEISYIMYFYFFYLALYNKLEIKSFNDTTVTWFASELVEYNMHVTYNKYQYNYNVSWTQACFDENLRHINGLVTKTDPSNKALGLDSFNSLWPSDAKCRYRSGSTLAQVMACCQRAPSHYLNQRWLTINEIFWHSFQVNFYLNTQDINPQVVFEIYTFEITATMS